MTPYARVSARLSRLRDAENAAWGDRRLVGEAARKRMRARLGMDTDAPSMLQLARMFLGIQEKQR